MRDKQSYTPREKLTVTEFAQLLQPWQTSRQEAYPVPKARRLIIPGRDIRDGGILWSILNTLRHQSPYKSIPNQKAKRPRNNPVATKLPPPSQHKDKEL